MKASDFKIPFSWEERRSLFLERCLYIPPLYDRHREWEVRSWTEVFGNDKPVMVEYCSGNGQWIAERAKREPEINWIAVEKRFDRARKIWARSFRENLPNLLVVMGEARVFSQFYAPEKSVSGVFVNFPDPWPKQRHAKHRLVQREFLEEIVRIGKKEMRAMFVTDDRVYRDQILEALLLCKQWHLELNEPYFSTEWPEYGDSFFESLWRTKKRTIYYLPAKL